jgi:hypothetical protein
MVDFRFIGIGGITFRIEAEFPLSDYLFDPILKPFECTAIETEFIVLQYLTKLPNLCELDIGEQIYRKPPWAIYSSSDSWTYVGIDPSDDDPRLHRLVIFNKDHTSSKIYLPDDRIIRQGGITSITLFPTDQILLARLLADRQGCILHSAGMVLSGQGLLFGGHSSAGKSTIVTQLRAQGEILCDDRIILRRWPEGFRIHGTWSHGDVPDVSPASAPLRAVLLLEQANENRLLPVENRREAVHSLLPLVIKPLVTADWWEKTLDTIATLVREVPVYRLQFDRSGRVMDVLKGLL